MQVKSIVECSKSILQYLRPALSYHLSLRSLLCLFLSGHLRHVLVYANEFFHQVDTIYVIKFIVHIKWSQLWNFQVNMYFNP